jgi:branched-chain amino acid transport system ATP-binding protein
MTDVILSSENLTKRFGKFTAVDGVSLDIASDETVALIGPNGAGKTTLFNCLSGVLDVTSGTITFKGEDVTDAPSHEMAKRGLSRSFQISSLFEEFTVIENLRLGTQIENGITVDAWNKHTAYEAPLRDAEAILDRIRLSHERESLAKNLSQGQKRQLEIGLALSPDPEVLLLDEPTAGLAGDNVDNLVEIINDLSETYSIVFIEHDMEMVMGIPDSIIVMNQGQIIAQGPPSEIRESKDVQDAYLGTGDVQTV